MVTQTEFDEANAAAMELSNRVPKAVLARYDSRTGKVMVDFASGLGIFFSPSSVEGLTTGTTAQLEEIEISPSGYGLHFPQLDADIYLPALLEGVFGSARWMAEKAAPRPTTRVAAQ